MTSQRMQREELALERIGVAMWDVRESIEFIVALRDSTAKDAKEVKDLLERALEYLDLADDNLASTWNAMMIVLTKERGEDHETCR